MEIIKDHSATAQSSESRYEISMSHISRADAVSCSISGVLWSPSLRDKCHIKTSPPEAHRDNTATTAAAARSFFWEQSLQPCR